MPRIPEPPLTNEELQEIHRRRTEARERARRTADEMTDEEDAALTAAALSDPDALPMADEQLARMRPAHEVVPHLVAAQLRNQGGRPKSAAPKQMITLRIKPSVVDAYRATGSGWQTRMTAAIEEHMPKREPGAAE